MKYNLVIYAVVTTGITVATYFINSFVYMHLPEKVQMV